MIESGVRGGLLRDIFLAVARKIPRACLGAPKAFGDPRLRLSSPTLDNNSNRLKLTLQAQLFFVSIYNAARTHFANNPD